MKSGLVALAITGIALTATDLLVPAAAHANQSGPANEELTHAQIRADIRELAANIKKYHPRPFRIISEQDFDRLVETKLASLDAQSSRKDLLWAMSEILASIGCGHSNMLFFNQESELIAPADRFPVDVRMHDGRLFVMDPLVNGERLARGQEIIAINGVSANDLRTEVFAHIGTDAGLPDFKDHAFNFYATAYLTYALGFPAKYELTLRGQTEPISLSPLTDFKDKPVISPSAQCQDRLCYSVDEDRNIGIMTIRSFDYYGADGQIFADFTSSVFDDLVAKKRAGLLIDTRGILGGSGLVGAYLLRHLAKQPFAYFDPEVADERGSGSLLDMQNPVETGFDGPTFILMDSFTVSSVPHFYAVAKENSIATLIGEPAGGGKSTTDGKIQLTSTHAGVTYTVARMRFDVVAPHLSIDEAVQPDIFLSYSLKDVLERTDSMRDNALDLLSVRTGKRPSDQTGD